MLSVERRGKRKNERDGKDFLRFALIVILEW